jgi:hypothetical protein
MMNLISFGLELGLIGYALWVGIGAYLYTKKVNAGTPMAPQDFLDHISKPIMMIKNTALTLWNKAVLFVENRM